MDSGNWLLRTTTIDTYYTDTGESYPPGLNRKKVYYKVRTVDNSNKVSSFTDTKSFTVHNLQEISDANMVAQKLVYKLKTNYPNPFNAACRIGYQLHRPAHVRLTVYNASGQMIETLVNRRQKSGRHEVVFDGANLSGGVYFYRLQTDQQVRTRKMVLLR